MFWGLEDVEMMVLEHWEEVFAVTAFTACSAGFQQVSSSGTYR